MAENTIYNVVITVLFVSEFRHPGSLEVSYLVEQMFHHNVTARRVGDAACVMPSGELFLPEEPEPGPPMGEWKCVRCGGPPTLAEEN